MGVEDPRKEADNKTPAKIRSRQLVIVPRLPAAVAISFEYLGCETLAIQDVLFDASDLGHAFFSFVDVQTESIGSSCFSLGSVPWRHGF